MQVVFAPSFLCMEMNALEKFTNSSVALRSFACTPLMI